MTDVIPFEATDNGFYRVVQPAEGMEPDCLTIGLEGHTWRLSGYAGKAVESRVGPDVLVYSDVEILEDN